MWEAEGSGKIQGKMGRTMKKEGEGSAEEEPLPQLGFWSGVRMADRGLAREGRMGRMLQAD